MSDLLVKLYDLKEEPELYAGLREKGITIKKALSPDRDKVLEFVRDNFEDNWVNECKASFTNNPITCYIAVKDKKVIGFACYDATARNFFGPTGVLKSERGQKIGYALLHRSLLNMWEDGYGYAIIGWTGKAAPFYVKTINAIPIENSFPGVYKRMVDFDENSVEPM